LKFLQPSHLGLNPHRRRRRSLLVVLSSSSFEIDEKAGTRRHLDDGSKFVSSRARAKRNARNYLLEMSITRLLFAIRGASRGASALWSHTFARAKSSFFLTGAEERKESNRGRKNPHRPKKKEKSFAEIRAR